MKSGGRMSKESDHAREGKAGVHSLAREFVSGLVSPYMDISLTDLTAF